MRRARNLVIALVVVLGLAVAAFWYVVLRDDAPEELGLTSTTTAAGGGDGSTSSPASVDGAWQVVADESTVAGFRIEETFVQGLAENTAVGRTGDVTGTATIVDGRLTAAEVTVDLTALEFTDEPPGLDVNRRSGALSRSGLETNEFPTTTFTLTEPVELPAPEPGAPVQVTVTGDLTLHGVTRSVEVVLDAQVLDDQLEVATADPVTIALADFEIDKPVLGPVAEVADQGSFELRLRLARG